MNAAADPSVKTEWFSARSERRGSGVCVYMSGNADMDAHDHLKRFLSEVHVVARAARADEVVFKLEDLYFMNSSCMSLLLRYISDIVSSRPNEQYRVRLCANPEQRWQRKSFDAMQAYAPELVTLE